MKYFNNFGINIIIFLYLCNKEWKECDLLHTYFLSFLELQKRFSEFLNNVIRIFFIKNVYSFIHACTKDAWLKDNRFINHAIRVVLELEIWIVQDLVGSLRWPVGVKRNFRLTCQVNQSGMRLWPKAVYASIKFLALWMSFACIKTSHCVANYFNCKIQKINPVFL